MIYVKAWKTKWKKDPKDTYSERRICYKGFFLFGFLPIVIIRRQIEFRWAKKK
jgi:hypothetical protein